MSETCGPLYQQGLSEYGGDERSRRAFACGFVSGQAEKVYLGACPAAMFRPSQSNFNWLWEEAQKIAARYGLVAYAPGEGPAREIWICRNGTYPLWWEECERDTAAWHSLRAQACGIPLAEADALFHRRKGYGEVCDKADAR